MPVPVCRQVITKASVKKLIEAVLAIPYISEITDESLEGLPVAEVMFIRLAQSAAEGNHEALKILLDRVLGKPKQFSETVTMKMSYRDFLEQLAKKEEGDEPAIQYTAQDL